MKEMLFGLAEGCRWHYKGQNKSVFRSIALFGQLFVGTIFTICNNSQNLTLAKIHTRMKFGTPEK